MERRPHESHAGRRICDAGERVEIRDKRKRHDGEEEKYNDRYGDATDRNMGNSNDSHRVHNRNDLSINASVSNSGVLVNSSANPSFPKKNRRRSSPTNTSIAWGVPASEQSTEPSNQPPSQQPNYELSGVLAAETNTVKGVAMKVMEPSDAAIPTEKWRLYVFKGKEEISEPLSLHRASHFLIGRDPSIADIPLLHPSISKQHAVIQFRKISKRNAITGLIDSSSVVPYLMDLESTNGTFINKTQLESARYYSLCSGDDLSFGSSSRTFTLLNATEEAKKLK